MVFSYLNAFQCQEKHIELSTSRDLDMNQEPAWYVAMRIREKMSENDELLKGMVEADETYVGGKPEQYLREVIGWLLNA